MSSDGLSLLLVALTSCTSSSMFPTKLFFEDLAMNFHKVCLGTENSRSPRVSSDGLSLLLVALLGYTNGALGVLVMTRGPNACHPAVSVATALPKRGNSLLTTYCSEST